MNDAFEMKVRAAATAGWWTLLTAAVFLAFQWIAYLFLVSAQPGWLPSLWGLAINWETVGPLWICLMAIFKFCLWLLALLVLWLTFWARQLRKNRSSS